MHAHVHNVYGYTDGFTFPCPQWSSTHSTADCSSDKWPSLPALLRLKVPQKVATNYIKFGIILLNDKTGSLVLGLKQACPGNLEDVVLMILHEWMKGNGLPVTWESLVQALRETELSILANQIQPLNH